MPVKKISNKETFDYELSSAIDVLVKFEADWCSPCKAMTPIVEEFAKNNPQIKVISVDIEGDGIYDVLGEFGVKSVPTFVKVKNRSIIKRAVGTLTRSEMSNMAEE